MLSHLRANVIGYLALFLAMTGGAYAATIAPKNSVATSSIMNGAVTAKKIHDGAVTTAKFDASAVAPNALNANNADRLGGTNAADYQQRVTGSCDKGKAIASVGAAGDVSCATPITPINHMLSAGSNAFDHVASSPLQVATVCHDGGTVEVELQNLGDEGATLNWMYSDGGTTVNASGTSLSGHGAQDFQFAGKRLEGQFILGNGEGVTTLHLHAWDGATACEVRGTAEFAAS
jgi:hypothetical protein